MRCVWSFVVATPSIACADEPPPARSLADVARETAARAVERVWHDTQDVAQFALGLLGVEYRWGGETPERGLDCSGLVRYVFQQVTGVTLPRTARELSRVGSSVQLSDLQVGDLVFFNTRRLAFSHVGLYLGDSRFIHAPARGREVEISTLASGYWQKQFNGARRLVGVLPAMIPEAMAAPAPAPASADAGGEEAAAQP
jgi:cell wall-associated NlpC family hydrolase